MKFIKKFIVAVIWLILILLVTFNVYNFVSINLLHKDLAKVNGYALLEVVSGSMEPTLQIGDLIVIDTNYKEYKKDDIITFRDVNGAFVTHRIISIENGKMITQGDANNSQDDEMSIKSIVGKYCMRIPNAGKIMASFKNPIVMGLILVIGIICCGLVSTDKDLVPKDLTDEQKEFLEYKKNKENEEKNKNVKVTKKTSTKGTIKSTKKVNAKPTVKGSTKTSKPKSTKTSAKPKTSKK